MAADALAPRLTGSNNQIELTTQGKKFLVPLEEKCQQSVLSQCWGMIKMQKYF